MIELFLGVSLAIIMFSLGLSLEPRDFAVAWLHAGPVAGFAQVSSDDPGD